MKESRCTGWKLGGGLHTQAHVSASQPGAEPPHGREQGELQTVHIAEPVLVCTALQMRKPRAHSEVTCPSTHSACSTRHWACTVWHQAGRGRGKKGEGRAGLGWAVVAP